MDSRFFVVLDYIPMGAFVIDREYRLAYWNRSMEYWSGKSNESMLGKDIREVFPRMGDPVYLSRIDMVLEGGAPAVFSPQIHGRLVPQFPADKVHRQFHVTVNALKLGGPKGPVFALFILQDVSEVQNRIRSYVQMRDLALKEIKQKEAAETSVRKSELVYRTLFEQATEALVVLDPQGRVVRASRMAEILCGQDPSGVPFHEAFPLRISAAADEKQAESVTVESLRVFQGETRRGLEVVVDRREGRRRTLLLGSTPLRDEEGRIDGGVVTLTDISERKAVELRLMEMAARDGLTGVFNRRHFWELARRDFARARRLQAPLTVIMADLDYFKSVNDRYGHEAGDKALVCFTEAARRNLRGEDLLGRVGGEEFAILMPEAGADGAVAAIERIRKSLAAYPVRYRGEAFHFTASFGIARQTDLMVDFDDMLREADKAMYRAKTGGRDRVEVALCAAASDVCPLP